MRIVRMRWDMAICFFLAVATIVGLFKLDEKTKFSDKVFHVISSIKLPGEGNKDVSDGEVGGYATDDLPVLETEEEIRDCDGYFTIKMTLSEFYDMYTVPAQKENYEYKVIELENNKLLAVKLNKAKVQKVEKDNRTIVTLPTGVCVYEDSEVYEKMKKWYEEYDIIDDFYIDMDGKAKSNQIANSISTGEMIFFIFMEVGLPVLFMAFAIGVVLLYHVIGVKIGIFPPLRLKNKED